MGEEVEVMGIVLSARRTKSVAFLLTHPKEKNRCVMIAPDIDSAEKFSKALSVLAEKKGE